MKYISTRDDGSRNLYTFEEAVCSGYAPDGGLFVPESGMNLPQISSEELKRWSKLPYWKVAYCVLRLFISEQEISNDDLESILNDSYSGFTDPDNAVPVVQVGSALIAELFHGPTMCFKDLGMRVVVNCLSHFATNSQRNITLLVSTTGDTGPAAVRAVSDIANPRLNILVHYPHGQISSFQRKQLTTIHSPHVQVAAYQGGGDDMDTPIKRMQLTSKNQKRDLCGINSYNIGRPLTQMVHFIWTYLRAVEKAKLEPGNLDDKVDIILPTGAMGNIAGGYMAKQMGIPIGLLCAGVNINDIVHRTFQYGQFHKSERLERTLSEAINIQVPYNFERLLFYLTGGNCTLVRRWMTQMDETNKLDLDDKWLELLQTEFKSARVTDDEMCNATQIMDEKFGYFVCPHTAVAIAAADKIGYRTLESNSSNDKSNSSSLGSLSPYYVIMATASPCKFEESVTIALGENGWKRYWGTELPQCVRDIVEKDEVPPIMYLWQKGKTLDEVQHHWEQLAWSILNDKFPTTE